MTGTEKPKPSDIVFVPIRRETYESVSSPSTPTYSYNTLTYNSAYDQQQYDDQQYSYDAPESHIQNQMGTLSLIFLFNLKPTEEFWENVAQFLTTLEAINMNSTFLPVTLFKFLKKTMNQDGGRES
jgi:hypothetical protein